MSPSRAASRWIVVGPYLAVVLMFASVAAISVDLLSTVRAAAAGESHYSKAQKDAALHLQRYLRTRDPEAWRLHRAAIDVPIGARRAREALERDPPDEAAARAGFLQGGSHPDDVSGLIRGFRHARGLAPVERAIESWRRADALVGELEALGVRSRLQIERAAFEPADQVAALSRLSALNAALTRFEAEFSQHLGQASRLIQQVVLASLSGVALALVAAGVWLTARLIRRQSVVEDALRESNQRWERAARAAEIGVFELDLATGRLQLDGRAGELFGLSGGTTSQDLHADDLRRVVHPDDVERLADGIVRAGQEGHALEMRFRVGRGSGWRDVEINTRRAEAATQVMNGLLWDVSADVQAEHLRLEKEAAERSNRAKTEFLSRVSHELRTPLNAVLGFAQLLAADERDPLTPSQRQRMEHVLASGRHLLGLINDVLDLSRIDQGAFALSCREVDLNALLDACVQRAEPMARQLGVAISLSSSGPARSVRTDPLRIEQVLGNLLSNAIKYNRPHGRVSLRLQFDAAHWQLEVEDTGRGIAPSAMRQLYQPFNRLGAEHSRIEGTGLGLVITRQLVIRLGGELEAQSEPGVGSTFRVRLPLVGPAGSASADGLGSAATPASESASGTAAAGRDPTPAEAGDPTAGASRAR